MTDAPVTQERADDQVLADFWAELRADFPADEIEKLPKPVKGKDENKGRCAADISGGHYSADGWYCGGWHARAVHLDYVGHAGITMRLNEVCGPDGWYLRPFTLDERALPAITGKTFWAVLSIRDPLGVWTEKTDLAENFYSNQEAWGDALRRCAMRFGIGTYLWSKSEKAAASRINTEQAQEATPPKDEERTDNEHTKALIERITGLDKDSRKELIVEFNKAGFPEAKALSPEQAAVVNGWIDDLEQKAGRQAAEERLGAKEVDSGKTDPSTTEAQQSADAVAQAQSTGA
jgi:hypothetical protein